MGEFYYNAGEEQVAIRQIGTNAIPELLRMIRSQDGQLKKKVAAFIDKHQIPIRLPTSDDEHEMAALGFHILGASGQAAVPELVELLKRNDPELRVIIIGCLGDIGPEAKAAAPLLVGFLDSTNLIDQFMATLGLGQIHGEPEVAVPALVAKLSVSNKNLSMTIWALGQFGKDAKPAIPILRQFLGDTNPPAAYVQEALTNALKEIEMETK